MEKESKNGQMEELTSEISREIKGKDLEYINGLTVRTTKEIGKMANRMVKEFI